MQALRGRVELRDLSFRYTPEGPAALRDISLDIPAGSSLGIIGKPGSGKTTLASLLFHLYPVERGRLFIDGRDINDIQPARLRSSIAYVPQDSFLFSDTVGANVAFSLPGSEGLEEEREVIEAAELAAVKKDIDGFSEGFRTRIGERGVMLSGGQKQRVAIARALMVRKERAILVLDDALSSVDAATEAEIMRNLRAVMRGMTTIIIAHRISTVKECDAILVLEGGRIAEAGTHRGLADKGGFYRKLWDLQRMKGV
jgi:ATP-binding cassette subfamily B protein